MLCSLFTTTLFAFATAESGLDGWLRYAPIPHASHYRASVPSSIVTLNSSTASPIYTAGQELQAGIQSIFGKQCNVHRGHHEASSSIVVGTVSEYEKAYGSLADAPELYGDGFWLSTKGGKVQILGLNERGALYGAFEYLSMLAQGNLSQVAYVSNPEAPIRWTNEVCPFHIPDRRSPDIVQ